MINDVTNRTYDVTESFRSAVSHHGVQHWKACVCCAYVYTSVLLLYFYLHIYILNLS